MSAAGRATYDEFSMFADNASEVGLAWHGPPTVHREFVEVAPGRQVSALVWGTAPPEIFLVHGGGQNAHTWDTVALALDRPLVALDLPGHGHSDWPGDARVLDPRAMAEDAAVALAALAPEARLVVGMSLGGATSIALAGAHPELVPKLALIDITPGVTREKSSDIAAFLAGPETFASFDEILERTIQFNPTRSESSLRRGVLHNSVQRDDGTWTWRHQLGRPPGSSGMHVGSVDFGPLWDVLQAIPAPVLLVRGARSPVVDDADEAEFHRRRPADRVITVDDAGHSIQGDQPLALAAILDRYLDEG
jgi:pimeloyl-ACP methyl ester carboxylesterase